MIKLFGSFGYWNLEFVWDLEIGICNFEPGGCGWAGPFLDRLFEEARLHVQAGVYASRPWPFETILISILIEHEKALIELRSKLRVLEEREQQR